MKYSCSVIIAPNPGFLFQNILESCFGENRNRKPGLEARVIIVMQIAIMAHLNCILPICVLVLPLLMEYSCSVIIVSNPGFPFQILSRCFGEGLE